MTKLMTVREIRKVLFVNQYYTVIGQLEMTNIESTDFLYAFENQDCVFNVIDCDTHFLIWS